MSTTLVIVLILAFFGHKLIAGAWQYIGEKIEDCNYLAQRVDELERRIRQLENRRPRKFEDGWLENVPR
jgi:hypothetical protein